MLKICNKCGKNFPATVKYFYRHKGTKSGLVARCKSCIDKYNKEYRKKHPQAAREYSRWHRREHIESYRKAARDWWQRRKKLIINHYGGKCTCCGENQFEFLTIDHINGDGARHRREININSGQRFYAWLVKNNFPPGFQVLCANCNLAKYTHKTCPHQKERIEDGKAKELA